MAAQIKNLFNHKNYCQSKYSQNICYNHGYIKVTVQAILFICKRELKYIITKSYTYTMLQKISKCEVKAWLCWSLIILPALRFYVKSNLGEFKRCKNVILANLKTLNFEFLVHLGLESCSNVLKSKLKTSKIAKNYIFGPFELAKMTFLHRLNSPKLDFT